MKYALEPASITGNASTGSGGMNIEQVIRIQTVVHRQHTRLAACLIAYCPIAHAHYDWIYHRNGDTKLRSVSDERWIFMHFVLIHSINTKGCYGYTGKHSTYAESPSTSQILCDEF